MDAIKAAAAAKAKARETTGYIARLRRLAEELMDEAFRVELKRG